MAVTQSEATRAHRPEVCYAAQGLQIAGSRDAVFSTATHSVRVRHLARLGDRIEPISYWITVGDKVTISGTEQKVEQLSYSVRGVIPDGMLVRVSSIEPDTSQAYALHQAFVSAMTRALRSEC